MKIRVEYEYTNKIIEGNDYSTVYELLQKNGIDISAPCGGAKKCGKCFVKVSKCTQEMSIQERTLLGNEKAEEGYRLACFTKLEDGMEIIVPIQNKKNKILTSSNFTNEKIYPPVNILKRKIMIPDINNQISDLRNIRNSTGMDVDMNSRSFLSNINEALRNSDFEPYFISYRDKIIGISHKPIEKCYGISVDIGTTTVAMYLFDLITGNQIDVISGLNKQKTYGADVISRINFASMSEHALEEINKAILDQINLMITEITEKNNINKEDIYLSVLAGNTTMMHLLIRLNPENIGKSPFIPVSVDMHEFKPVEFGISINKNGFIMCMPSVSGYIGADIVAGVIATGMNKRDNISILLDIGTNGEIVLGNNKRMLSCSTAAGPAFEGANIKYGTGGIEGAIDSVKFINNEVVITTIEDKPPIGICGSGVVDVLAQLLEHGIVDETGRFNDEDELPDSPLSDRVFETDGAAAFRLTEKIHITQKDIREIQNAKAAISAGIKILIKRYGLSYENIDTLFLAGGFGNYINIENAAKIGLIPPELKTKVVPAGNTAGAGASMCLLNKSVMEESASISDSIHYVELSSDKDFTDEYIECMMF